MKSLRRYVKTEPELWWPEKWRDAGENVKQGSSDDEYKDFTGIGEADKATCEELVYAYKWHVERDSALNKQGCSCL